MKTSIPWLREALLAKAAFNGWRVLLVAAHPDDEVIGATSVIRSGLDLQIVHTTDGSPEDLKDALGAGCSCRAQYAALRRQELTEALGLAGRSQVPLHELDFTDQACSFDLVGLTKAVRGILTDLQPDLVITHPYEGGHPDHDSTAFAVQTAVRTLRTGERVPVVEMTSYHLSSSGIATGEFLEWPVTEEITIELSPDARSAKEAMLACFRSQRQTLQYFDSRCERFRLAPAYDFSCPPHPGTLFYEQFAWGVTGARWRQLACAALDQLAPVSRSTRAESALAVCH